MHKLVLTVVIVHCYPVTHIRICPSETTILYAVVVKGLSIWSNPFTIKNASFPWEIDEHGFHQEDDHRLESLG